MPWARDEVRGKLGIGGALEHHSLIFIIPHIDNGRCMKEEGILGLRGAVEAVVGSGWMVAAAGLPVFSLSSSWHYLVCSWEGIRDPQSLAPPSILHLPQPWAISIFPIINVGLFVVVLAPIAKASVVIEV
ncbi:hypothetical protein EDD85DRAFT_793318 [Armillaria nabsnona]|nr:hypothetical protein EDD85DRAFT_793318 [Armillaria nabsnona]